MGGEGATPTAGEIVEVIWLDAVSGDAWEQTERARFEATKDAMVHRSCGYLVLDEEHAVLIACSRRESGEWVAGTMQIPRSSILNVKRPLREVERLTWHLKNIAMSVADPLAIKLADDALEGLPERSS